MANEINQRCERICDIIYEVLDEENALPNSLLASVLLIHHLLFYGYAARIIEGYKIGDVSCMTTYRRYYWVECNSLPGQKFDATDNMFEIARDEVVRPDILVIAEPRHLIEMNGEIIMELNRAYGQFMLGGPNLYFEYMKTTHAAGKINRIKAAIAERMAM
jgi:hypothetical protein